MSNEVKELYNQRLGRFQAAIAMEPLDRIPLTMNANYVAEKTSGYTFQQLMYDPHAWAQSAFNFAKLYPELDAFYPSFQWMVPNDVVNSRLWRIPGRDISPNSIQQFVENEYMKADEYRMFIDDPIGYRMNVYLPRIYGELEDKGSIRSSVAFLKSGIAFGMFGAMNKDLSIRLQEEVGMPKPWDGLFFAPFDFLSDNYRGLNGIMKDMFRQPDNVIEACEAVLPGIVQRSLAMADPLKRYPIFIPTHKPCFMSPKQFEKFYWPTFKKGVMMIIEAGYTLRILLEGDWSAHWHYMAEFPKGKVLCDIDNEGDIFEAKKAFGHQQCITGGIPVDMLILGTPEDVRARVKLLCETVGEDGGWMPHSGGLVPQDTKPENFKAMLDATMEYGRYSDSPAPAPKPFAVPSRPTGEPSVVTPWDKIKETNGWTVPGDEQLIKQWWNTLEAMAHSWIMSR